MGVSHVKVKYWRAFFVPVSYSARYEFGNFHTMRVIQRGCPYEKKLKFFYAISSGHMTVRSCSGFSSLWVSTVSTDECQFGEVGCKYTRIGYPVYGYRIGMCTGSREIRYQNIGRDTQIHGPVQCLQTHRPGDNSTIHCNVARTVSRWWDRECIIWIACFYWEKKDVHAQLSMTDRHAYVAYKLRVYTIWLE